MFTLLFGMAVGYSIRYIQVRFGSGIAAAKNRFENEIDKNLKG